MHDYTVFGIRFLVAVIAEVVSGHLSSDSDQRLFATFCAIMLSALATRFVYSSPVLCSGVTYCRGSSAGQVVRERMPPRILSVRALGARVRCGVAALSQQHCRLCLTRYAGRGEPQKRPEHCNVYARPGKSAALASQRRLDRHDARKALGS